MNNTTEHLNRTYFTREDYHFYKLLNSYEVFDEFLRSTVHIVGVIANLLVVTIMLMSESVKKNPANCFIGATLMSDAFSSACFYYIKAVKNKF